MNINLDNLKDKNKMKNVILTCLLTFTVISLSFAQLKVVAPDGNVGIGISSPTEKLHVDGKTLVMGDFKVNPPSAGNGNAFNARAKIGVDRAANGAAFIDLHPNAGGNPDWVGRFLSQGQETTFTHKGSDIFTLRNNHPAAAIKFITNNGGTVAAPNIYTALTVLPNGNVGIGTGNPTYSLQVTGQAAATAWNVVSDGRLKNVIGNYDKGLDAVLNLNPVVYQYNGKGGVKDVENEHVGLIAQEYQKIAPNAVSSFKYIPETGQEDGNLVKFKKGATEEYLAIDPSQITYMLVNAVKELQSQIDDMSKVAGNVPSAQDHVHYSTVVLNGEDNKAMLAQNAPNPFTKNTKIDYYIPSDSKSAQMSFTDITGKEVKSINIDHTGLGTLDVSIADMPIGIYSYSLVIDGSPIASMKMVLSK